MLQGLSEKNALDSENNSAIIRGIPFHLRWSSAWALARFEKSENSGERAINGGRGGRGLVVHADMGEFYEVVNEINL